MTGTRNILVVAHALREDTVAAARRVTAALHEAGARPVFSADDRAQLGTAIEDFDGTGTLGIDVPVDALELAIVLGGDGTILRSA